MGCGCNKNKSVTVARKAAAAAPSVLFEVVNEKGRVQHTRSVRRLAKQLAESNPGWHYRVAGTTTPITD